MIQTLKSGDALTKELMNGLIVKANGLATPSDSFVNTSNGPLLVDNKIQYVNKFRPAAECLFQTKYVPAFEVTNRDPASYDTTRLKMAWQCYLGPDYDSLSSAIHTNVKIEGIWDFTGEAATTIKFEDSTLSTASGFFDLAIYDADGIAVNLIKAKADDDDEDPKYGLVFADEKTTDFAQMSGQSEFSGKSSISVVKKVTIGKLNDKKKLFQMHLGVIDFTTADGETDPDTSLSALHQMSLERTAKTIDGKEVEYEQIYGFELSGNAMDASQFKPDEGGNSAGKADVLVRWTKEDVDKTKQIAYVSLSSISGDVISGDTQATEEFAYTPRLQSIELVEGLGCGTKEKYYKLHNFEQGSWYDVPYNMDCIDYPAYYSGGETYVRKNPYDNRQSSILVKQVDDQFNPRFAELQYATPAVKLPPFTRGDAETTAGYNSIQVGALNGGGEYDPHYYGLYGWQNDETQNVTVNLQWGQQAYLNDQPFLVRDYGTLRYKKVKLSMPAEPLIPPDFTGDIDSLTNEITVIQNSINWLSGQVSSVTEYVLNNVWRRGADYTENYGASIGNGYGNEVIDLNNKRLCGCGWNSEDFYVGTLYTGEGSYLDRNKLYFGCGGEVQFGSYGSYLNGNKLYFGCGGEVRLGSETLNETDIAKLHQLISDHGL